MYDLPEAALKAATMAAAAARRKMAKLDKVMSLMPCSAQQAPTAAPSPMAVPATSAPLPVRRLLLSEAIATGMRHRALSKEHKLAWECFVRAMRIQYLDELTPTMALDYMDSAFGDRSPKRYNNVLTLLNTVCRSCLVEAGLSESPFASILPRRLDQTEHYRDFTMDEVGRILAALEPHPHWRLLSLIALNTGLRLESCRRLSPSMISDGMITITPSKTARFGRAVQIPLTDALAKELPKVKANMPYCSAYPFERYFRAEGKIQFFAGLLDSVNVKGNVRGLVGFHSWRETYVTRLSAQDVPEKVIRGIVGHTSQRMTDLYNHDTESVKKAKKAIEKALSLDGLRRQS